MNLERVYGLTIKNHERILYAEKEVARSTLLPAKANSIIFPRLDLSGDYIRHEDPITFEIDPQIRFIDPVEIETIPKEQVVGGIHLHLPLYQGTWHPRRKQADFEIVRSIKERSQVIQDILFQATTVYYEILKTRELIKNAEEILELTREEKRVAHVRLEEGAETEDAVLSAEIKILTTESNLIEYRNRLKLLKAVLNRYMGIDAADYDLAPPAEVTSRNNTLEELVKIAMESRQDYRKALSAVDIAESEIQVAKSRFHPSVNASWDYITVNDPAYYQDENYWIAGIKLNIPIFEGGSRIWDLKDKRESLSQTQLLARDLHKGIRIEIEEAMLAVNTLEGILDNLKKREEMAEKHYEMVFSKFSFGGASSVALSDALRTLALARRELISTTYDHQLAILKLEKTLGLFAGNYLPRT
ncbi:MAG: TolC family protein [Desulfobulbaceae bacterium]|nr:TolC family protein [Desulfobulbaceae bacterium]